MTGKTLYVKIFFLTLIIAGAAIGGVFYDLDQKYTKDLKKYETSQEDIEDTLSMIGNTEVGSTTNPFIEFIPSTGDVSSGPIDLSPQEYLKVKNELDDLVYTQNPNVALKRLGELMQGNQGVMNSCHGLVHAIGHSGYDKYQDFSLTLSYTDDICGAGYIHGVIEEYFADIDNVGDVYLGLCAYNDATCIHGIGHGLMYFADNEISNALSYCDGYSQSYQQNYCAEGVFMENFETNSVAHTPKYLRPQDPGYPCYNYGGAYREICYYYSGRYVVRLNGNNYVAAIKQCEQAGSPGACIKGVGAVMMRQNLNNPKIVEDSCSQASSYLHYYCVAGSLGYYITNSRSVEKARNDVCGSFTDQYMKNVCLGV